MSTIKVNKIENTATTDGGVAIDATGHVTVDGVQLPTAGALSNRNLIINGAMNVAQRGTSSTSTGYQTVDRFNLSFSGLNESATQSQVDVASGTTPYSLGFRKAFKITNGNQTSIESGDHIKFNQIIEAQNLAQSGWDYTSSSSYVTLQFWIKSSVSQNFYLRLTTFDGTQYSYVIETGTLTADTWTQVTKAIPGNSNLTFNNDNGQGLLVEFTPFRGTSTTGTRPLNAWAAFNSATRVPDMTSTWYTTNDATLELTGFSLEVGEKATPFEHRSYGDELARCQRYFQHSFQGAPGTGNTNNDGIVMFGGGATGVTTSFIGAAHVQINPEMRATPTITLYDLANPRNTGKCRRHVYGVPGGDNQGTVITDQNPKSFLVRSDSGHSGSGIIFHYEVASEL